jgi:two-component system response regulator NreC
VVLSAHEEENFVASAFQFGADAYVFKEQSVADLVLAVRSVLSGERYISPYLRAVSGEARLTPSGAPSQLTKASYDALTVRERQVLDLTAQGYTNGEIGERLGISARTVETHRAHLMLKLGLKSRLELTRYAQDQLLG